MEAAWPALLVAIVGGVLALAGSLAVELRRDRRRQIGAARLVIAQLHRSQVEIEVLVPERDKGIRWLNCAASAAHAAAPMLVCGPFVGRLGVTDFETVDNTASRLQSAAEFGFTPMQDAFEETTAA